MSTDDAYKPASPLALNPFLDTNEMQEALKININDITQSLADQTSKFVIFAANAVRAKRQFEHAKLALEIKESALDAHYRKILKEENPKVTEGAIRAAVVADQQWKILSVRVIDAQQICRLCDAAERAFEHRREMVKQIANDQAREHDGSIRVMRNQDARDSLLEKIKQNASQS